MELRIRFASEVYISGNTIEEIREKWGNLPLFSEEAKKCFVDYVETESVEYEETGEELSGEDAEGF